MNPCIYIYIYIYIYIFLSLNQKQTFPLESDHLPCPFICACVRICVLVRARVRTNMFGMRACVGAFARVWFIIVNYECVYR